jgi:integrase
MPLRDLKLSRIERSYSDLVGSGVGKRTIQLIHAVLHVALEKAIRYGYIAHNPAHGAALPRRIQPEMKVLDADQATRFLVAAHDSSYEMLYYLAVHTGMRQGELFGLTWEDLDQNRGELSVQREVKRVSGGGWVFAETETKRGRRKIKLGSGILKRLESHRTAQQLQKAVAGSQWDENDLIFPSAVGTPCNQSNLRKDFLQILDRARLPHIRFHDLRHTAASLMLNNGVPPIVVANILGRSKPSTTLDIYGHLYQEIQGDAARIMDDLVSPISLDVQDLKQFEELKADSGQHTPD